MLEVTCLRSLTSFGKCFMPLHPCCMVKKPAADATQNPKGGSEQRVAMPE